MHERIAVLDFGSQYTQLIARKVRELRVKAEIFPYNHVPRDVIGIILSGGPSSVYEPGAPLPDPSIFSLNVPILGICYGMQAIVHHFGGKVEKGLKREYGRAYLEILSDDPLFHGLKRKTLVWMSHGDKIEKLPPGFMAIARTENSPYAVIKHEKIYGVQFHPEVHHTEEGKQLLENFLYRVCNAKGTWTMESFVESAVREIRERVKDSHAVLALSGGVDSSVAAVLAERAIGKRFHPIFVDTGLLRKNEKEEVVRVFRDKMGMDLHVVEAEEEFLSALKGVKDPEEKRRIIGHKFIEVFEREAEHTGAEYLIQGTLYPDRIESSSVIGPSRTIKTHHNVGGLPERMKLKLVEPLRELFKDEVRRVARILGLPESIWGRHPFPGPGLAVRVLGEITKEKLDILREADAIFIEELRKHNLYHRIWQAFCVLLPVRSVGVMGDYRTYEYVVVLRAVTSEDGMTADWFRFPHDVLAAISTRIVNEVRGINRVVYDITSKPPGTIEWE